MRVTPSVLTLPQQLTSSSATEPHDPAAYAAGTTYAYGAIVKVVADYSIYESLLSANTGHTPDTNPVWWRRIGPTETAYAVGTTYPIKATVSGNRRCYESLQAGNTGNPLPVYPEKQTLWWVDVGPTNKWAMLDLDANTQTVWASPLTVVITPGQRVNTIGLTGLQANQVQISATSVIGGGTVYPNASTASSTGIFDLNTRAVNDGYDYCFEPFSTLPGMVVFDLPPYSDIIVTITLTSTSGNVKCGSLVMGTYIYLGDAQYGASNDGFNFSTVNRDLYGTATLVPRRTLPKLDIKLMAPAARVNKIKDARVLLNARPALWTGLDDANSPWFDMLTILGIYNKFVIGAVQNNRAEISLGLEEI